MRIGIMTDLEGVAGIPSFDDWCLSDSKYYEKAKMLLTEETNAAIRAFIELVFAHEQLVRHGLDVSEHQLSPFLVKEMRCLATSTALILTSITSPTEKSSEGCLMYLSDISEM